MHSKGKSSALDKLEETIIAVLLGAMTLITFANVVVRKAFESNILWGLETTVFLFAWLVLLDASYAVKKSAHLGVDVVINAVSPPMRRALGIASVAICIAFSFLLLKGSWDYWANFANLPQTTGRWFPTGFQEMKPTDYRAWYIVNDIPNPFFLKFLEDAMNYGDSYDKLPRFIPYAVLPLSAALLLYRFCQAGFAILTGKTDRLVASHEVEEELDELRHSHEETK